MIDIAGEGVLVPPRADRRRRGRALRVLRGDTRAAVAGLCRILNRGLHGLPKVGQSDLAQLFDIDQATVSRLIAAADAAIYASQRARRRPLEADDEC